MIDVKRKELCTGCSACRNICPVNCINMESDDEGFWYPQVEKEKCVGCSLCEKVCPVLNKTELYGVPEAYAAINKNELARLESSSGGIFTLIADNILTSGGAVFGAAFDDDFSVIHFCAKTKEELGRLKCSKYVQSIIENVYKDAEALLLEGKKVLFTGTPCQIAGFKLFLGRDYDNLICQDIICHGVPSPLVWRKYLKYMEDKNKSKITKISFRDKRKGWKNFSLIFLFENGAEHIGTIGQELYLKAFNLSLFLRPCCYSCAFKTLKRQSDITLADFWGISNHHKEMDDDRGTSLLIIHTEKGRQMFNCIKDQLLLSKVDINDAIKSNPAMIKSMSINRNRIKFFNKLNHLRIDKLIRKYSKDKLIVRVKRKIKLAIHYFQC